MKPNQILKTLLALALVAAAPSTRAGSHTWSGAGNKFWSHPANWSFGGAPVVGETHVTLTFPTVGAAARNATNNLTGLAVENITFSGDAVHLWGNPIHLTGIGPVQITGNALNDVISTPLVLDTAYNVMNIAVSRSLIIDSVMSGPGGFTKIGPGLLRLTPVVDNSYLGETKVLDGELALAGQGDLFTAISIPATLTIGQSNSPAFPYVELDNDNQIADSAPVRLVENGFLRLNGFNDNIGSLVLQAGGLDTRNPANTLTDTLGLNGNVSCLPHPYAGFLRGLISLNGADRTFDVAANAYLSSQGNITQGYGVAGITKTGAGALWLHSANSYNGFTKVNGGTLGLYHSSGLGTIANGTMVASNATLEVDASIGNEALTLNGAGLGGTNGALVLYETNSWSGGILIGSGGATINTVKGTDFSTLFTLSGVLNGFSELTKIGGGTLRLGGASDNTFSGTTRVREGSVELAKPAGHNAIAGPLVIGKDNGNPNDSNVRLWQSNQIQDSAPVQITSSGLLDLNHLNETIGSLAGNGGVSLGFATLTTGGNNSSTVFDGVVGGVGFFPIIKTGSGTFTLNGTNTCSGQTAVNNGKLVVNGVLPGFLGLNSGGSLSGTGTVGHVTTTIGKVGPGNSIGKLNTGNLLLNNPGSSLEMELNGTTPGSGYDQLNVLGTVTLGGATLNPKLGFASAIGNQFILINNNGVDAVSGTFANLPEGGQLLLSSRTFVISYQGGDGNDVVLTQTSDPVPPLVQGLKKLGNGHIQLEGNGIMGLAYGVQANADLKTTNWLNIGTVTADANGKFSFIDDEAPNFPMRFYRFVAP